MDVNKVFSGILWAGIAGLLVLNYKGANELFKTVASSTTGFVKTVQGRQRLVCGCKGSSEEGQGFYGNLTNGGGAMNLEKIGKTLLIVGAVAFVVGKVM